jgi:predicted lipoprotein
MLNNSFKILLPAVLLLGACKKEASEEITDNASTRQAILTDISSNVISATYSDMSTHANELYSRVTNLQSNPTQGQLNSCREEWRNVRAAWEQSEGFLFGPVSSDNIDPRIDSWPVNHIDLDSILASTVEFTPEYIDQLQDALKGFHPVEYLLFGVDGTKTAAQLSPRELSFMVALCDNLNQLCAQIASNWQTSTNNSYIAAFKTAGNGSQVYATQREAFEELVNAMIGICDEVAGGKISEPFEAQDPSLEESPYAQNSLNDFRHNLLSVQNIYLGTYSTNGKGLEDFVSVYNLSLDSQIKQDINQAIASLDAITDPFGIAITSQATLVSNAITRIKTLKTTLEEQLLPLIQQRIQS